MSKTTFRIWLLASLAWLAFVAYGMYMRWPHIPLDMGGADPSVDAAYQAAQLQHIAKALFLGLGGSAVAYLVMRVTDRVFGR